MRIVVIASVLVCLLGADVLADKPGEIGGWDWDAWRRTTGAGGTGGRDPRSAGFSDAAVRMAIKKGCEYLWSARGGDGSWPAQGQGAGGYPTGPTAMAAYALLAAGVSPVEKRMAQTLDWLAKHETNKTYGLGLRCQCWYLANRKTGGKYSKPFKVDLLKLIKSTARGAYNYNCNSDGQSHGDNSNSQYGVLGVWGGAMARQEIPEQYWYLVLDHWKKCQNSDGGWTYSGGASTATMTAAGIATMFVCFDNLFADKFIKCDVSNRNDKPIRDGLAWMDKNFNAALAVGQGGLMGHGDTFYFLYGVERVGLASGFKYFGTQDWYKLGATKLLRMQNGDGSWKGVRAAHVSTSFAILFLVRGQHAIAFNKLEHPADWNNRPRDVAGLTRWMSNSLERQLNWQIISMKSPVEEWHDAPIVYLAGAQDPNFSDEQIDKLRSFVWQGGTIMSVTECNGKGFTYGIRKAYGKIFPHHKLKRVGLDHPLYGIHHRLHGRPSYYEITNGIRPLAIHTDTDLSKSWQLEMKRTAAGDFQAPSNVLMYVTDKGQLRHRGVTHWPADLKWPTSRTLRIARLKYKGDWDPEPLAFERFRRLMASRAKTKLEVYGPVEIDQLKSSDPNMPKVAAMTGTGAFRLSVTEKARLRKFIDDGGTLMLDAAGGSKAFGESAEVLLRSMFGRRAVRRLARMAPIYHVEGTKLNSVRYRRKARVDRGLRKVPNLRGVELKGRFAVIFSKEDVTGGLVGCPAYNCVGYEPDSCFEIMRNVIIYGSGGKSGKPGGSPAARRAKR